MASGYASARSMPFWRESTTEGVDVFALYLAYVSGTDSHAGHVVSAGVTWYFNRPGPGRDAKSR